MYSFVIGVDRRTGNLGADLERHLRTQYELSDFLVHGLTCSIPLLRFRDMMTQTDCIMEGLFEFKSHFYVALTTATIMVQHSLGPDPRMTTAISAANEKQQLLFDDLRLDTGYWVPPNQRNYTPHKPPDLLDIVSALVSSLGELAPQYA